MKSADIIERLDRIERATLLGSKEIFTIKDLAMWLDTAEKTIRNQINSIPHIKQGHRTYFVKQEIIAWQKSGVHHTPHSVEGLTGVINI